MQTSEVLRVLGCFIWNKNDFCSWKLCLALLPLKNDHHCPLTNYLAYFTVIVMFVKVELLLFELFLCLCAPAHTFLWLHLQVSTICSSVASSAPPSPFFPPPLSFSFFLTPCILRANNQSHVLGLSHLLHPITLSHLSSVWFIHFTLSVCFVHSPVSLYLHPFPLFLPLFFKISVGAIAWARACGFIDWVMTHP